jgi:CTP:molybdopterin cytidylyltransferase MocA
MDVILTAGGTPAADDPLYALTQGKPKALLEIAGKPMIQWALDALAAAQSIDQVVVVGLPLDAEVDYPRRITRIPNQGDMVANIMAGSLTLQANATTCPYALVMASDVPAVTGEMIDWLVAQVLALQCDLVYTVVEQPVMEKAFPGAKRSYIPLKDMAVCGGDVNGFCLATVTDENPFYRKLIESRKNALKQAAIMGFDTLLLILLRAMTLDQASQRISRRLGVRGKVLPSPYAQIAMDVDKPHQFALLEQVLTAQQIS